MQLLHLCQDVCKEEQEQEYVVHIVRAGAVMQLLGGERQHGEGHAIFQKNDPYNSLCDHILVYDRKQGELVASTRLLAWENISHLQDIGAFVCQGQFDILSLQETFSRTVEVSNTFIKPKKHNAAVMIKLWLGVVHLLKCYKAQYVMGVLSLDPWSSMQEVYSALHYATNTENDTTPIFAHHPVSLDSLSSSLSKGHVDCPILEQLKAVRAQVASEADANPHTQHIDLLMRARVSDLLQL